MSSSAPSTSTSSASASADANLPIAAESSGSASASAPALSATATTPRPPPTAFDALSAPSSSSITASKGKRDYGFDEIWTHFERIQIAGRESRVVDARCLGKDCDYYRKCAKLNELREHIAESCTSISWSDVERLAARNALGKSDINKKRKPASTSSSNEAKKKTQSSISDFTGAKVDLKAQNSLDLALIVMIVMCALPFSIVQNQFFMTFISLLRPSYVLPSVDIVRNKLLPNLYGKVCMSIENFLKKNESSSGLFTIHLDGWSDNSSNGIIGISVTEGMSRVEFFLKSVLVGAEGENAQIIFKLFDSVISKIGGRRFVAVCTDNASVMEKSRGLLVDEYKHILNFRCIPHLLNLFLCDLVKHTELVNLLGNVSKIVSFFSKSNKAFAALKDLGSNVHSFKSYIKVRWGSILNTFSSVLHNKSELIRLCSDNKKKKNKDATKLKIKDEIYQIIEDLSFWNKLEAYIDFLFPIKIAIRVCEVRTVCVADTVFVFAVLGTHLIENLKKSSSSSASIVPFSFIFYSLDRFLHRWSEVLEIENGLSMICYILHPAYRMKGVNRDGCMYNDESKTIESIVKNDNSWIIIPPLIKIAAQYWRRMGKSLEECKDLVQEIRLYALGKGNYTPSQSKAYSETLGPVAWWLERPDSELKNLALRLLQIKPNAAGMEVVFSLMTVLKPLRRNRLSPKKLGQMTKIRRFYQSTSGSLDPDQRCPLEVCGLQQKSKSATQRMRLIEKKKGGEANAAVATDDDEALARVPSSFENEVNREIEEVLQGLDCDDEEVEDGAEECELGEGISLLEEFVNSDDYALELDVDSYLESDLKVKDFTSFFIIDDFKKEFAEVFEKKEDDDDDEEEEEQSREKPIVIDDVMAPIIPQDFDLNSIF
jgi:hypothetical protein